MINDKDRAFKQNFKMMIEGHRIPFISAQIQESTDGVYADISLIPHETILDIKPGTLVQLFFREHSTRQEARKQNKSGRDHDWQWRLCFDGEFKGFGNMNSAGNASGFNIICKCQRNQYRRNVLGMFFSGTFGASATTTLFKKWGLKNITESGATKDLSGFNLNNINSYVQNIVGGKLNKGSYMEKAFMSVFGAFWNSTAIYNPIIRAVGARHKIIMKIICLRNASGYRAFASEVNQFKKGSDFQAFAEIIAGSSALCKLETAVERIANHFRLYTFHSGSPSFIKNAGEDQNIVVSDDSRINENGDTVSGSPNRLTSMMLLPMLTYTAPPRCNILYPSLYDNISYNLDYDTDLTRAVGTVPFEFEYGDPGTGDPAFGQQTFSVPRVGRLESLSPITLEEYDKGVLPFSASMPYRYVRNAMNADVKNTPKELKDKQKKQKSKSGKLGDVAPQALTYGETQRKLLNYELMYKRQMQRQGTVTGCFNPYAVIGFPMAIIKEPDTLATIQVPRSMIGYLVQKIHSINAEANTAQTTFILTHLRPVNEPTDIDEYGQPQYMKPTDLSISRIDSYNPPPEGNEGGARARAMYDVANGKGLYTKNKEVKGVIYKPWSDSNYNLKDFVKNPESRISYINEFNGRYPYAKDLFDYTVIDGKKAKAAPGPWLDYQYSPQYIGRFYGQFFFNNPVVDGGMMFSPDKNSVEGVYDTIHEAVEKNLEKNNKFSYIEAINDIWRPICTESEFYLGIVDAITKDMQNKNASGAVPQDEQDIGGITIAPYDPYPNFDEDFYVSMPDYFKYKSFNEFINRKDGVNPRNGDKFADNGTISFSHDDGRTFDLEKAAVVKNYIDAIKNMPSSPNTTVDTK